MFLNFLAWTMIGPCAANADTPKKTIQNQVYKIVDILNDPALKDDSFREKKRERIRPIIDDLFDYREFSKRILNRYWKNINSSQREEFEKLISQLLEKAYMDRFLKIRVRKIKFLDGSKPSKNKADVRTTVITEYRNKIPVRYRMMLNSNGWKVYDIVVEGISLVKHYRSRMKRILIKRSPEELLEHLRKKVHPQNHKS